MAAIRVQAFDGLVPKLSPTLLSDSMAQVASNVKLYSKELRYWRGPVAVVDQPPPAAYQTLYRLFHLDQSVFLLWTSLVDVAVSPIADTNESRIYYTGDGPPKKTNWAMATSGAQPYPSSWMPMGVTVPVLAPHLALTTDGTGTLETRAYLYTNVSTFGTVKVESAPSPPGEHSPFGPANQNIDVHPIGSTVTISNFSAGAVGENITSRRIYRSVVGATTVGYEFVDEIPVAQASYADQKTAAQLGEVCPSIGWLPPPAALSGLVSMASGSLAGFVGNTVWFSEAYMPHAWPAAYAISLPVQQIIGLGISGSDVVVMTDTTPYFIHGGAVGAMYTEKIPLQEPCVGKATISWDEDGVIYASPNGLVGISSTDRGMLTDNLFTYNEWRPLVPNIMKSAVMEGRYFGVFPNETPSRAMILSRTDPPALSFMEMPALCMHVDAHNGFLFYVNDTDHKIYQLDADDVTPLSYRWRSKRFFTDQAVTFSLMRLDADYGQVGDTGAYQKAYDDAVAHNQAAFVATTLLGGMNDVPMNTWDINGSILWNLPEPPSSRTVQVVVYGDDGANVANLQPFSLDPVRVPPFKCRQLEFEIYGNVNVRSLHFATTMEELKGS